MANSSLALLGGGLGLGLSVVGVPAVTRMAPDNLAGLEAVGLILPVLVFTALATVIATLLFGLLPAMRQTSARMLSGLSQQGRGNRDRQLMRSGLVATQTGLANNSE